MTSALATLTTNFAARFGIESNQAELIDTLKLTAFKGSNVTDAQMTALMLVAQQFNLNPWTREIYAFPDKGGIVPVVGVDGWSRIMNDHPQFDGMGFEQDSEKCTCTIYRKDRAHPIKATEYMDECKRSTGPWQSHPKRMLRHKAMIQCARLAFGFGGIYDPDEAEGIVEGSIEQTKKLVKQPLPELTSEDLAKRAADRSDDDGGVTFGARYKIGNGEATAEDFIAFLSAKFTLTDAIKNEINSWSEK